MSTLLIGFQDASPPHHVLAKLDTVSERLEWLELNAIDSQVHSISGLCRLPHGYAVLLQAIRGAETICYLAELDNALRLRRSAELTEAREGFCPVVHNGTLLLIDHASDRVIRVIWPEQAAMPTEEPVFSAQAKHSGRRLSAIVSFQGRLYLSLSGAQISPVDLADTQAGAAPKASASGTVLELESGTMVTHLAQAGALIVIADTLYCLDAGARALIPIAGTVQAATAATIVIATHDRLRAFAHHDGHLYIGAQSAVLPDNHAAATLHDASCSLYLHGSNAGPARRIDMSGFSTSIGALLVLPDVLAPTASGEDPLLQRLRALNAYTPELLRRHTHADHYHSECEALIRQLIDEHGAYVSAARLLRRLLQHATEPKAGWHFDYATCLTHVGSAQDAVRQFQLALTQGYPAALVMLPLARARAAAEGRTKRPLEPAGDIDAAAVAGEKSARTKPLEADAPGFDSLWLQTERTVEFDSALLELMALLHSPDAA